MHRCNTKSSGLSHHFTVVTAVDRRLDGRPPESRLVAGRQLVHRIANAMGRESEVESFRRRVERLRDRGVRVRADRDGDRVLVDGRSYDRMKDAADAVLDIARGSC